MTVNGINNFTWIASPSSTTTSRSKAFNSSVEIGQLLVKKSNNTLKQDSKELTEQQAMMQIANSQQKLSKYEVSNQYKNIENIEKGLKNAQMCSVCSNLKGKVKDICDDFNSIMEALTNSDLGCKTEAEINDLIKEAELKLQQNQYKANVYSQRAIQAQKLGNKLEVEKNDPKKAALIEKIDLSKITAALTTEAEDAGLNSIEDNKNDKTNNKAFEDALKNDEISNVIKSVMKYLDKGEKDKILDDFVKEDNTNKQTIAQNNTTNPFKQKFGMFTT